MPNKDSFTFSDKLRKSKSEPLSKRLPSIVGGKNTQKRTLVQRAQRDLPFILVAALALLLLPFLSRNGSDDITGTGDIQWGSELEDAPSFQEGGYNDIQPSGSMKDPLDLILRPTSAVEAVGTPSTPEKSAYGSSESSRYGTSGKGRGYGSSYGTDGSGTSSSSYTKSTKTSSKKPATDYDTRSQYDKKITKKVTKPSATGTYGKSTKPSVRKSFERKATEINRAFRPSKLEGGKGSSGVSYSLPIGQGPNGSSAGSIREGVRPVALQPMEARGNVGRGENLYAEARRSIGAMNAGGPAKANLLAAQMRDVDGKPGEYGAFGGPHSGAGSPRPGTGGGPGNTNGYHIDKPWWWDMMKDRSQRMWDLYYYTPRKMFWENIYKVGLGLFNCLLTGDKGGDVSNFFGKGGDSNNLKCITKEIPSFKDFVQLAPGHKTTDKDGNKTEEYDNDMARLWFSLCPNQADGTPGYEIKKSSDKNFFQVRAACLGLDVVTDWLKAITKHTKYGSNCIGVNSDPMKFSLDIERSNANGKHNKKREETLRNKTVIALLAKTKKATSYESGKTLKDGDESPLKSESNSGTEFVVYIQKGNTLNSDTQALVNDFRSGKYPYCHLSRVVAFIPTKSSNKIGKYIDEYNAEEELSLSKDLGNNLPDEESTLTYKERGKQTRRTKGSVEGTYTVQGRPYAVKGYSSTYYDNMSIDEQGQVNAALSACKNGTSTVKPFTLEDVRNRAELGKDKKGSYAECKIWEKQPGPFYLKINDGRCDTYYETSVGIKERNEFSATISNSEDKHVFAIMAEQVDGETVAKVIYIVDFKSDGGEIGGRVCETGTNDCTYRFTLNTATMGWNPKGAYSKEGPRGIKGTVQNSMTGQEQLQGQQNANNLQSSDIKTGNEYNKARCDQCLQDRGTCTQPDVTMLSTETAKIALEAYQTCLHACDSQCPQALVGNYGAPSNQQSQSEETYRGSGKVFWIVTDDPVELKVKVGDDLPSDLGNVDVWDFLSPSQAVIRTICSYNWCDGLSACGNPNYQRVSENMCKEDNSAYMAHRVTLDIEDEGTTKKKDYLIKIKDSEPVNYPTNLIENLPECEKLCHGADGKVYKCDQNDEPKDPSLCPYSEELKQRYPDIIIPPCPVCCNYTDKCGNKGKYLSVGVEVGKGENKQTKYYIIDKDRSKCENIDATGTCEVAAWSESPDTRDFIVYTMSDANYDCSKLPLIPQAPETLGDPFTLASSGTYTTNLDSNILITLYQEKHKFDTIHQQSKDSGYPTNFTLFPQLVLPPAEEIDLSGCNFCGTFNFSNADIQVNVSDQDINGIKQCLEEIKKLETLLPGDKEVQALKTLNFYGYASVAGDDISRCPEVNNLAGGIPWNSDIKHCNIALSEDRNLHVMEQILESLNTNNVKAINIDSHKDLKGFRNTKCGTETEKINDSKRYNRDYQTAIKQAISASDAEFTFDSIACGSGGAEHELTHTVVTGNNSLSRTEQERILNAQRPDRAVVITPMTTNNPCEYKQRMTCGLADEKMKTTVNSISKKLNGRATIIYTPRQIQDLSMTTENTDPGYEEIAEAMRTESVDPNANPQA